MHFCIAPKTELEQNVGEKLAILVEIQQKVTTCCQTLPLICMKTVKTMKIRFHGFVNLERCCTIMIQLSFNCKIGFDFSFFNFDGTSAATSV